MTMPEAPDAGGGGGGGGGAESRSANVTLTANVDPYSAQLRGATAETNTMSSAVDTLTAKLHTLTQAAGRKLLHFTAADAAALSGAGASAALFEKQLGTLRATAAVTAGDFKGLKGSVESAFLSFPVSRGQVVELTNALTNMGVKGVKDIRELTQVFIKLGASTGEGTTELASQLTQLSRLMGTTSAAQIGNYANALLVVSKNAGVSAGGVLSFAQAIAPMARAAGIGEAAVLGISAAFTKAGADGYPAATAFNKIIGDISQDISSGSPDLLNYSNLIGVTAEQFKKMDKATALTAIFDTLQKQGPQAVNTLNRLGLDGVRTMKSLQAVAQSGGLGPAIAQASGASHDQASLNNAAKEAMHGLSDELVGLRNNFTQLGTAIGTTFLKPLTVALQGFNWLFHAVNQMIKPFTWLLALVGSLSGAFGGLGGAALLTAGVVAKFAAVGYVAHSSPLKGLRQGFAAGRPLAEGAAAVDNQASRLYAANQMRAWQKPFYAAGAGLGSMAGPVGEPSRLGRLATAAARVPFLGARLLVEGQSQYMRDSHTGAYDRKAPFLGGIADAATKTREGLRDRSGSLGSLLWAAVRHPTAARGGKAATTEEADAYVKAARAAKKGGEGTTEAAKEAAANLRTAARANTEAAKASHILAREAGALSVAFVRLGKDSLVAGVSLAKTGVVKGTGLAASAAGGAIRGAGNLAKSIGVLGGIGIAASVGTGIYQSLHAKSTTANDLTPYLNPLQKLNEQYGIATAAVATFGTSVQDATAAAVAATTSWSDAARIGPEEIAAAAGTKVSDDGLNALSKYAGAAGGDTDTQLAYVRSLGITDPKSLAALRPQLITALGAEQAAKVSAAFVANPDAAPDYTKLGAAATATQHGGIITNNPTLAGNSLIGGAVGDIKKTEDANSATYGAGYGKQQSLQSLLELGRGLVGGDVDLNSDQGAIALKTLQNAYQQYTGSKEKVNFTGEQIGYLNKDSGADLDRDLMGALGATPEGQQLLKGVTGAGGTIDPTQIQTKLSALKAVPTSALATSLEAIGPTGHMLRTSPVIDAAAKAPGDANKQHDAAVALYEASLKTTGSFSGVTQEMDKFLKVVGPGTVEAQAAAEAKARAVRAQDVLMPTLSPAAQAKVVAGRLADAKIATRDQVPGAGDAQDAAQAAQDAQTETSRQRLLSLVQYGISATRAERDYQRQMGEHDHDFKLQMKNSDEAYHRSRLRGQRDFAISMRQSQESFDRQQARTKRDFDISMKQQSEQAAQSIYDPYTRVLAVYTLDAGTLLQNLTDQNKLIADQYKQLAAVRKAGLSQAAIETLDLANPANAQQLTHVSETLTPQLVDQINKSVATRVAGTTELTQSGFSRSFREAVEAFKRGNLDAITEFGISRDQANAAQKKSLDDMATDQKINVELAVAADKLGVDRMVASHKLAMKDAGDDLALTIKGINGTFQQLFPAAMDVTIAQIAKYAPKASAIIMAELNKLKATALGGEAGAPAGKPTGNNGFWDGQGHWHEGGQTAATTGTLNLTNFQGVDLTALSKVDWTKLGGHAAGGVSTRHHLAQISEGNTAEAIIPLDHRGQNYMAGMYQAISRSVVQQMLASQHPMIPTGAPTTTHQDYSTTWNIGELSVQADDPRAMAAALDKQKRLTKLARPPRASVGA